eukprot:TRINITY_DN21719_c0_g2_i1.p1 TRINITY_DN21719_c0_g2~~TRINITY_DN21719_c0_g2_i1.p1  ORF type:complete len:191 (-),score=28.65 TRINITY_DN21719_c0_g2_i1:125-649(-)
MPGLAQTETTPLLRRDPLQRTAEERCPPSLHYDTISDDSSPVSKWETSSGSSRQGSAEQRLLAAGCNSEENLPSAGFSWLGTACMIVLVLLTPVIALVVWRWSTGSSAATAALSRQTPASLLASAKAAVVAAVPALSSLGRRSLRGVRATPFYSAPSFLPSERFDDQKSHLNLA